MKKTIKTNVAYNNVIDFKTKQKLDYKQWLLNKEKRELPWHKELEQAGIKIDGRKYDKNNVLGAVVCFLNQDTSVDVLHTTELNQKALMYVLCDVLDLLRNNIKDA